MRALILALCLLTASLGEAAQLTLTWTDNAAGQAWFVIERAANQTGPFAYLGTNPTGVTGYYDSAIVTGQIYCYRVAAVNTTGSSPFSNVACGIVPIPPPLALTVKKIGTGTGTVIGTPGTIVCGTVCAESYAKDAIIVLMATPHPNSRFSGWSGGGCSGTGFCRITVTIPVVVTATFTKGRK